MTRAALVVGIDPGVGGAIGMLGHSEKSGPFFFRVESMPTEMKKSGRRQVDVDELRAIFADLCNTVDFETDYVHFLIERVSAMPGQGVSSMFSLGDSFGCVRAMAATFGEVSFVSPGVWKGAMKLDKDKSRSLSMARRLYPDARPFLYRKKDEGRAEAILLAHYARKHLRY